MTAENILPRYLSLERFAKVTGYPMDQAYHNIEDGKWMQGELFTIDDEGQIMIDMQAYYDTVENSGSE
ncbi:hypothetical protein SAMN06265795_11078 [Noviherbaspirillum humi]|uniref:Uncharacterized protein n=1 Tax=Noviherbaspirillum humi TaxID=1688639 RepID=A0A239IR34_9BURK|nr:hypothetical protein [Noviherbaspirillum humi]SNS96029.1 hypothetical protein SAMN06265795_11078 [Noviherbaspirillum humi]